jgi:hypothetical protein
MQDITSEEITPEIFLQYLKNSLFESLVEVFQTHGLKCDSLSATGFLSSVIGGHTVFLHKMIDLCKDESFDLEIHDGYDPLSLCHCPKLKQTETLIKYTIKIHRKQL